MTKIKAIKKGEYTVIFEFIHVNSYGNRTYGVTIIKQDREHVLYRATFSPYLPKKSTYFSKYVVDIFLSMLPDLDDGSDLDDLPPHSREWIENGGTNDIRRAFGVKI